MTGISPAEGVRVWLAPVERALAGGRRARYESLLTGDERERMGRFIPDEPRFEFLIGRALARTMLSTCHPAVAPRDWRFRMTEHGRPELDWPPAAAADLRFNLSHTRGLVACAVTIGREVGVDVELVSRSVTHDIAERFFSPREVEDLRSVPEPARQDAFFDYWTLKEAYIKARGLGLAIPLSHFSFTRPRRGQPPRVTFEPELRDEPDSWQFHLGSPSPQHRLALAVRSNGAHVPISIEEVIPEVPRA